MTLAVVMGVTLAVGIGLALAMGLAIAIPSFAREQAQEPSFQLMFDAYVRSDGIVGAAYVVLDNGKIAEAHNVGMADSEARQAVDSETIFHWASITKTLTAVAVMQLRDRGKLSLDDPIVKYVPELRRVHSEGGAIERVTLRHLLSHSAGFQSPTWPYRDDSKPWQPFEPTEWAQLVAMMPYQELAFEPGTKFQYSNPGFIYLARVIEALSGDPYETYVQKNLLTPLGMTRSYFNLSPYHLAAHRSNNYTIVKDAAGQTKTVANGREFDTGITTANGGLNAPLEDLAKWISFLSGAGPWAGSETILARKSLEEMWRPVVPVGEGFATAPPEWMGLSFFIYPRGESGGAQGDKSGGGKEKSVGGGDKTERNAGGGSKSASAQSDRDNPITLVGHTGHQAGFAAFFVMNPRNHRAVIAAFNTVHAESDADAYGKSNVGFRALVERAVEQVEGKN